MSSKLDKNIAALLNRSGYASDTSHGEKSCWYDWYDVESDSFEHASNQSPEHSKHAPTAFVAALFISLLSIVSADWCTANKTLEQSWRTSRPLGLHTLSTSCVLVRPSLTSSSMASAKAFKISIPHVCFLVLVIISLSPLLFAVVSNAELVFSPANRMRFVAIPIPTSSLFPSRCWYCCFTAKAALVAATEANLRATAKESSSVVANSFAKFNIFVMNSSMSSTLIMFSFSTFVFKAFAAKKAIVRSVLLFLPFDPSCSSCIEEERTCKDSSRRLMHIGILEDCSAVKELM